MQIEVQEYLLVVGNTAEQRAVFEAAHDAVDRTPPAEVRNAVMRHSIHPNWFHQAICQHLLFLNAGVSLACK